MQLQFFGAAGEVTGSCHILIDRADIVLMESTYGNRIHSGATVHIPKPGDVLELS